MFGIDFLVRVSGFFLLPIYLLLMTQEEYGLYSYLLAIMTYLGQFFGLGFYISQMKVYHDFSSEREKGSFLFTINFFLLLVSAFLIFLLYIFKLDIIIISYFISENIYYLGYRLYFLFYIFLSIFSLMVYSFFITTQNLKFIKIFNVLKLFLLNGIVLFFLYINTSQDAVLIRFKYSFLVELALFFLFLYFFVKKMVLIFNISILKKSLKIGLPVMLASFVAMIYGLTDRFFLERYYDLETLGIYTLGITLCSIIPISMASFHTVFSPIIFKEKDNLINFKKTNKIAKISFITYIFLGILLFFSVFIMFSFEIISSDYFSILYVLPIMIFGAIFYALSQLYQLITTNLEKTQISLIFNIVSTIICVVFSVILVPKIGMYGAAFSVLLASSSSLIMHFYYIKKFTSL